MTSPVISNVPVAGASVYVTVKSAVKKSSVTMDGVPLLLQPVISDAVRPVILKVEATKVIGLLEVATQVGVDWYLTSTV